ncbi:zinc ribbon domain-containing protein [Staphylococcus epidermidis]|nr:zinc ribbon domain-containing protein [Staphylococcus epidermidis]
MRCERCGNPINTNDSFCSKCGHKINIKEPFTDTEEEFSKVRERDQNNNKLFNTNKLNKQSQKVLQESKDFFQNAFTSVDKVIKSDQKYSFKLVCSLLIIGILIITFMIKMFIPYEVSSYLGTDGSVFIDILVGIIFSLAIFIGTTFSITKLVIKKQNVTFQKVLSDYTLINSVTVSILLISIFLFKLGSYKISIGLITLSLLLFSISGAYLIGKYSSNKEVRLSSFYGVVIYIIIILIIASIFGETLYEHIVEPFINEFNNIKNMIDNFGEYNNY